MLLSQPQGGISDDNISLTGYSLALVPIYGAKDAGRNFWKRLCSVMRDCGLEENYIFEVCYSFARNGELQFIFATHNDGLIWACKPSAEYIITKIKREEEEE